MFLFFLISTTHSKLCSELQRGDFSESFTTCIETLDEKSCLDARTELDVKLASCYQASSAPTFIQKLNDFTTGFLNGIQDDPTSPSDCVVALIELKKRWETVFNGLTKPQFATPVMFVLNFNSFVSELDSTYGLCYFSMIYDIFHPSSVPLGLNTIFTRWLMEKTKVKETINDIRKSLNDTNFISAGIYSARLFTYLTGYMVE